MKSFKHKANKKVTSKHKKFDDDFINEVHEYDDMDVFELMVLVSKEMDEFEKNNKRE